MTETTIIIPLENLPQSKQSTRIGKNNAYTCPKKKAYQNFLALKIREQFKGKMLEKWAIVDIEFGFKKPKKLTDKNSVLLNGTHYKTTIPDRDNLAKPVLDAMTQAGVLIDDKIVFDGRIVKLYYQHSYIKITIKGE